jgi:N6-adenosine-specific RNA methylase IME4
MSIIKLEYHEYANLFPDMDPEEFEALKLDIKEKGLIEPIVLYEGKILDGKHRYRACLELGIEPMWIEHVSDNPLSFVISMNQRRRHLTKSQLAAIAYEALPLFEAEAKKREFSGKHNTDPGGKIPQGKGRSAELAGKTFGVDSKYVKNAKSIQKESPELLEEVKQGKKTITQAKRELNEKKKEKRRKENRDKIRKMPSMEEAIGEAKFSTILIDPPWDYSDEGDNNQLGRSRPDYDTMKLSELEKLPIAKFADKDCHLYLWITNRSLPKGFDLVKKWGFTYITCLTWCKPSIGMGNYFRGSTEQILFAKKGSQLLKRKDIGTWFEAPRGEKHSSKPVEIYDIIESCSYSPYLEIFARSKREGWVSYGAEV